MARTVNAQHTDSLSQKTRFDTATTFQKTDSPSIRINDLEKFPVPKIDSLEIIQKIDHLKDSLALLKLPDNIYKNKLDSLSNRSRQKLQTQKVDGSSQD